MCLNPSDRSQSDWSVCMHICTVHTACEHVCVCVCVYVCNAFVCLDVGEGGESGVLFSAVLRA